VALLRGINVGGRIIKMADLKSCLEKAGFGEVKTLLQSGNVIFESSSKTEAVLKDKIEQTLTKTFGYPAKVQVIKVDELARIIKKYPFKIGDPKLQNYVVFLEENLAGELASELARQDLENEQIKQFETVIYWQVEKGMTIKSPFSKYLTKAKYKQFNTVRNLNTLKRIAGL
jgi:uncharacterized protein (DUF1697 family)